MPFRLIYYSIYFEIRLRHLCPLLPSGLCFVLSSMYWSSLNCQIQYSVCFCGKKLYFLSRKERVSKTEKDNLIWKLNNFISLSNLNATLNNFWILLWRQKNLLWKRRQKNRTKVQVLLIQIANTFVRWKDFSRLESKKSSI